MFTNTTFLPTTGHLIWPLELWGNVCQYCKRTKDNSGLEPKQYGNKVLHVNCYLKLSYLQKSN